MNCETGQTVKIADPQTGYLDSPFFSPDGGSILYTENESVNGAFGGPTAIALFDLDQNRETMLVEKKTVAAVPCPPSSSKEPVLEAFKRSQAKDVIRSYPRIVSNISSLGNEVVALLSTPIPAPCDFYLADSYEMTLDSILPEQRAILSLGKQEAYSFGETTIQAVSGKRVLIFSRYWKLYSAATGKPLAEIGPRNTELKSVYSPDLKYYLRAEAAQRGEEADHFVLYLTADGKRLKSLPRMAPAYGAVWSPESNRFAIFGVPMAGAGVTHHVEELLIYSIR